MNKEEDFACDNFAPQKWRKDTCRNCYQVLRLHKKRQNSLSDGKPRPVEPSEPPKSPGNEESKKPKADYVSQLFQQDVRATTKSKNGDTMGSSSKAPPKPQPPRTSPKPKKGQSPEEGSKDESTASPPVASSSTEIPSTSLPSLASSVSDVVDREPVDAAVNVSTGLPLSMSSEFPPAAVSTTGTEDIGSKEVFPCVPPVSISLQTSSSGEANPKPELTQSDTDEKLSSSILNPEAKPNSLTDENHNFQQEDQGQDLSKSITAEPSQVLIVGEESKANTLAEDAFLTLSPSVPAPPAPTPTQVPMPTVDIVPSLLIPLDKLHDAQAPLEEDSTYSGGQEPEESENFLPSKSDGIPVQKDDEAGISTVPLSSGTINEGSNPVPVPPPPPPIVKGPPPPPPLQSSALPPPPPPPPPLVDPIPRNIPKVRILSSPHQPDVS